MVKKLQQFSLEAVYPAASANINLNTFGDPDCGNYGVAPDFTLPVFKGKDAGKRKQQAAASIPALSSGLGSYKLDKDSHNPRISEAFENEDDPVGWDDGRSMERAHRRGNAECGIKTSLLSNEHFLEECNRLETVNGLLEGPVCGHCGTRYLEHPEEFIFNGTHGKLKSGGNPRKSTPSGVRIIHRPCKGKPGARNSVSLDYQAEQAQHDNVQILRQLVGDTSITALRPLICDPYTGKKIGVGRLYSRIFWLEKTLLAFERAKLKERKAGVNGRPV